MVIAIPITMGGIIVPAINSIDTLIVMERLQNIGFSYMEANRLYGQLTGLAQTLINLPQVFSMAIAISLVPAISEANARKRYADIREISSSGIRVTLLIGLPCAFGLFILATPIINLLYFRNTAESIASAGEILSILSFGVIFLTLVQSLTSILQGLGKPMVAVVNLFIGAVAKVFITYTLTGIRDINVKGAAIGTVVAYLIATILDFISVKKLTKLKVHVKEIFIKPLLASLGMALIAKIVHSSFLAFVGDRLSTVFAIIIGAMAYFILLIATGSLTYEDFKLLPKGDKIANKLVKLKLLKR